MIEVVAMPRHLPASTTTRVPVVMRRTAGTEPFYFKVFLYINTTEHIIPLYPDANGEAYFYLDVIILRYLGRLKPVTPVDDVYKIENCYLPVYVNVQELRTADNWQIGYAQLGGEENNVTYVHRVGNGSRLLYQNAGNSLETVWSRYYNLNYHSRIIDIVPDGEYREMNIRERLEISFPVTFYLYQRFGGDIDFVVYLKINYKSGYVHLTTTSEILGSTYPEGSVVNIQVGELAALNNFNPDQEITSLEVFVKHKTTLEMASTVYHIDIRQDYVQNLLQFRFFNSEGGVSTFATRGEFAFSDELSFKTFSQTPAVTNGLQELAEQIQYTEKQDGKIEVNTGYFDKYMVNMVRDFIASESRFIWLSDQWVPIILVDAQQPMYESSTRLYSAKFSFKLPFTEQGNSQFLL